MRLIYDLYTVNIHLTRVHALFLTLRSQNGTYFKSGQIRKKKIGITHFKCLNYNAHKASCENLALIVDKTTMSQSFYFKRFFGGHPVYDVRLVKNIEADIFSDHSYLKIIFRSLYFSKLYFLIAPIKIYL